MAEHSLTEQLAQQLLRTVSSDVRTKARLHLLDWLGCVAGGLRSTVAAKLRGADEDAVTKAAWLGNVLEMDDVHRASILHPGPVIWPTVLGGGGDMTATLDAAVRGYEAMITVGATFDAHHYAHWHNTATAGVFGAAAGAASLVDADVDETAAALGLAGSIAGGLWRMRHETVDAKQWHIVHAMTTGRSAAAYARHGITGPRMILEGEQGVYKAMTASPRLMGLGAGWRIAEVSMKPWGACRHAHPAIDAALELREHGALRGAVVVETYRDALTFCDRPDPASALDAQFSLQHAVAVVMERGEPALTDFEPDAIAGFAEARARVTLREDAAITARFPDHYGARLSAGGVAVERIDTLGDPERPLSRDAVVVKARTLMDWGGVGADADAAVAACLDGDDPQAIRAILERWL